MTMMRTIGRLASAEEGSALSVWRGRIRTPQMMIIVMMMMMMMMTMTVTMTMMMMTMGMDILTIQMGPRWRARMTMTAVFQWPREAKT